MFNEEFDGNIDRTDSVEISMSYLNESTETSWKRGKEEEDIISYVDVACLENRKSNQKTNRNVSSSSSPSSSSSSSSSSSQFDSSHPPLLSSTYSSSKSEKEEENTFDGIDSQNIQIDEYEEERKSKEKVKEEEKEGEIAAKYFPQFTPSEIKAFQSGEMKRYLERKVVYIWGMFYIFIFTFYFFHFHFYFL
jgi:hypothetical protein